MNTDRLKPYVLSLFRFVAGLIFFHYGVAKLFKFPPVEIFEDVTPLSLWGVAGMLEFLLGGMLMLGLLTRPVAFILAGEMAFAYFLEHFPHSFYPLINDGGLAIMLCFGCLYLAVAGGGPISLDAVFGLNGRQPAKPDPMARANLATPDLSDAGTLTADLPAPAHVSGLIPARASPASRYPRSP